MDENNDINFIQNNDQCKNNSLPQNKTFNQSHYSDNEGMENNNGILKKRRLHGFHFSCELSGAQIVYNALKSISSGKKDQHCVCEIDHTGISFITTDSAAIVAQGCANFHVRLFEVFEFSYPERVCFNINLSLLLNCLSLLGVKIERVAINMAYDKSSEIFRIMLVEGNVITECKLCTLVNPRGDSAQFEPSQKEMNLNMALRSEFKTVPVVNKCIISGVQLREALNMLQEMPGHQQYLYYCPQMSHFFASKHMDSF